MGITHRKLVVKKNFEDEKSAEVNFMVDSGAVFSLVPGKILNELEIKPHRDTEFLLADGSIIKGKVGDAYLNWREKAVLQPLSLEKRVMMHYWSNNIRNIRFNAQFTHEGITSHANDISGLKK